MNGGVIFAIVISAIAFVVLSFFVAREFEDIAEMKGYYEKKYFWWTFLLGPIGMLMVVALPNLNKTTQTVIVKDAPAETHPAEHKMSETAFTAQRPTESNAPSNKAAERTAETQYKADVAQSSAEKAEEAKPKLTMIQHLEYALKYTTDKGASDYLKQQIANLNSEEGEMIKRIIREPDGKVRQHISGYLDSIK